MSDPILSASDAEAVTAGVREAAPAKINLALHVTGQRADGYHLLDSLVVFADVGDRVWVQPAARMALRVGGPMAAGVPDDGRNLCWKAAEAFGRNVAITLDKHLPAAAGIGGGSADAAAVLRAMGRLFPEAEPVEALPLGADVPVCLAGQSARMQGIGETVHPGDLAGAARGSGQPRCRGVDAAGVCAAKQQDQPGAVCIATGVRGSGAV